MRVGQGPEHLRTRGNTICSRKSRISKTKFLHLTSSIGHHRPPLLLQAFISEQAKRQSLISLFPCLLPKSLFKRSYQTEKKNIKIQNWFKLLSHLWYFFQPCRNLAIQPTICWSSVVFFFFLFSFNYCIESFLFRKVPFTANSMRKCSSNAENWSLKKISVYHIAAITNLPMGPNSFSSHPAPKTPASQDEMPLDP